MQPDITVVTVTDEIPAPTFATMPGIASMNSVYADHNCGEPGDAHPRKMKGESLDGVEGWGNTDTDEAVA